jgi:uncharacterized protein YbjT (DUF2867 family)
MKLTIFGGTGFVGNYLVEEALKKGHELTLLVRPGSEKKLVSRNVNLVSGHIDDELSLAKALENADAVIYNIGIIREFPQKGISYQKLHLEGVEKVIKAMQALKKRRFILMSANGVKPDGTGYQRSKFAAEELVKSSGLDWTIFRPSLIFGDPGTAPMEFCSTLRDQMILPPIPAPLFYSGIFPSKKSEIVMSPIHVKDVAKIFIAALSDDRFIGKTYEIGGAEAIDWPELIQRIAKASGKKGKFALPVPAAPVKLIARYFKNLSAFPITADQIDMLLDGNVCDSSELFESLKMSPRPFDENELYYLRRK